MRVKVTGEIIPDEHAWIYDFFGVPYFAPLSLNEAILGADPDDRELILEINSPGGFVIAGFEIYSEIRKLRSLGWTTRAEITALAASAATTIMVACENVLCSPVAQVMIHLPMMTADGNRIDFGEDIEVLKSLEESILNGYEIKSAGKATRTRLRHAMEASTWMPAQKAIDLGLVDGIIGDGSEVIFSAVDLAALAGQVVNSLQSGFGMSYAELLDRYEHGVQDGSLQPDPLHPVTCTAKTRAEDADPNLWRKDEVDPSNPGWQMQAWIEIERERYRS